MFAAKSREVIVMWDSPESQLRPPRLSGGIPCKGQLKVHSAHSTLLPEGVQSVIQKPQVMPLILARCPRFKPIWEKHQTFWQGEEAGLYNDFGEFATFIVDCYTGQELEPIVSAFAIVEEFLADGDEEVQTAAAIGFLEDIQTIASNRPFGAAVFVQWLGPKSKAAWAEIEEMWRGKSSLMDVIRAESAAGRDKPKR
jgi:hypothetical protein